MRGHNEEKLNQPTSKYKQKHDDHRNQASTQNFPLENPNNNNHQNGSTINSNPNKESTQNNNSTSQVELSSLSMSEDNIPINSNNQTTQPNNNQSLSILADVPTNSDHPTDNSNNSRMISRMSISTGPNSPRNTNSSPNNNNTTTNNDNDDQNDQNYSNNIKFHDPDQGRALYRLAGMPPLQTILLLSIGPIINQFASAVESIVQTIWINRAMGNEGMASISSYMPFENICRAFGLTAACSGSNAIGGFMATNVYSKDEGSQVICDLLRVCVLIGIVTPAVLCPTVKIAVRWFGANEEIVNLGYDYILPLLVCTFVTCIYLAYTGFLIGEGRTMLYACITIVTTVANIAFFCPMALLVFKIGIVGAGISTVLSQGIAMCILSFFYFSGFFSIKPKFGQLLKKFSPLTKDALKACLSQGIANLSLSIPSIMIRKFIGKIVQYDQAYTESISGFHAVNRWAILVHRVIIGFITGYLPAASYALNSKNYKRYLYLTLHVNWLSFAWGSLTAILTFAIPKQIAMIFAKDPDYIEWATPMIRTSNMGAFFIFAQYTVGHMLRSLGMGIMAAVMGTLVHIIGMVASVLLLYYTDKHDAKRLMYAYPLSAAFGFIVGFAFIVHPYYKIYKEMKQMKDELSQDKIQVDSGPLPPVELANFDNMA